MWSVVWLFSLLIKIPYGNLHDVKLIDTTFIQLRPNYGELSTDRIEAYAAYDENCLYIIVKSYVPKDERFASVISKDAQAVFHEEDAVCLIIDPFCSGKYYWFATNLLGTKQDGTGEENVGRSIEWDAEWYSKVEQTDEYWGVTFIIPWKVIDFHLEKNKIKMNIIVKNYARRETDYIFDTGPDIYKPSLFGEFELENLSEIKLKLAAKRSAIGIPYFSYHKEGYKYGIDNKFKLGKALNFCIAYNPDYIEVEPDIERVSLSPMKQVYYPEKREFFIEGLHLLPSSSFYTRNIVDVKLGIKAYGTLKGVKYNMMGISSTLSDTDNFFVATFCTRKGKLNYSLGIIDKDKSAYLMTFGNFAYQFTKEYFYTIYYNINSFRDGERLPFTHGLMLVNTFAYDKPYHRGSFTLLYRGSESRPIYGFGVVGDYKSISGSWTHAFNIPVKFIQMLSGYIHLSYGIDNDSLTIYSISTSPSLIFSKYLTVTPEAGYFKSEFWHWEQYVIGCRIHYGTKYGGTLNLLRGEANEQPLYSYEVKLFVRLKNLQLKIGGSKEMSLYLAKPFHTVYFIFKLNPNEWSRIRMFTQYYEKKLFINLMFGVEKLPLKVYFVNNIDYNTETRDRDVKFYLKLKYVFERKF